MARHTDGQARDASPGPTPELLVGRKNAVRIASNDNVALSPKHSRCLPPDATAIIEPLRPPGGKGCDARLWQLRFGERWAPRVDPLTGWTGCGDPLKQGYLRFPDMASAKRNCLREGVPFKLRK